MKKTNNFWKNKAIFITGINGFIGSNLAKFLLKKNAKIYGLIRKIDKKTLLFYEKLDNHIKLFQGDVTDIRLIKRIINVLKIRSRISTISCFFHVILYNYSFCDRY